MKLSFVAVAFLGIAAVQALSSEEEAFTGFVSRYQKSYDGVHQLFERFKIFKANLDLIKEFNSRNSTWILGVNQFADLTSQEFVDLYTGLKTAPRSAIAEDVHTDETVLTESWDWFKSGYVAPVKYQGSCGSCWAFSANGAIESAWAIKRGLANQVVRLSEQQLVDCSTSFGNYGCNGGLMDYAFRYVMQNGICAESAYPYQARDGSCQASTCSVASKITSFRSVTRGSEAALLSAVAGQPVSVAVQAAGTLHLYKSGIISSNCGSNVDHAVLAVGYGTENGVDYWNVKNQWGTAWGEQGFFRIARNKGLCGIAQVASYPVSA